MDGRQKRSMQTQHRLLMATLELAERHGFDRLTFNQIIERAQSSSSTAYRHFGGKLGIVSASLDHTFASFASRFADPPQPPVFDDLVARLRAWDAQRDPGQDLRIWRIVNASEELTALHAQEVPRYEHVIGAWLQLAVLDSMGTEPGLLASLVVAARQFAVRRWLGGTPDETPRWPVIQRTLEVLRPLFSPGVLS